MIKGTPYFLCSQVSFERKHNNQQYSADTSSLAQKANAKKCSMGWESIMKDGISWLHECTLSMKETGDDTVINDMFETPDSIGSVIITASLLSLTNLHRRTKTFEPEKTEDDPDPKEPETKQLSMVDMLRNMRAAARDAQSPGQGAEAQSSPTKQHGEWAGTTSNEAAGLWVQMGEGNG